MLTLKAMAYVIGVVSTIVRTDDGSQGFDPS